MKSSPPDTLHTEQKAKLASKTCSSLSKDAQAVGKQPSSKNLNDQSETSHEVWNAFGAGTGGLQSPSCSTVTQSIARIQAPYVVMSTLGNTQEEPASLLDTPSDFPAPSTTAIKRRIVADFDQHKLAATPCVAIPNSQLLYEAIKADAFSKRHKLRSCQTADKNNENMPKVLL